MTLTKTYLESKAFNFALSRDVNSTNAKTYRGFNTLKEMSDYIQNSKTSNFYEQLNNQMRRLYCDLDFDHIETATKYKYMSISEFDSVIRAIISNISILLNHTIDFDDVIIAYAKKSICLNPAKRVSKNNPSSIYVSSCHLIFKNIKMDVTDQKQLIQQMNLKYGSRLDPLVYSQHQQFKLVYNSKKGKDSYLGLYNNLDCKFEDYAVSNINEPDIIHLHYTAAAPVAPVPAVPTTPVPAVATTPAPQAKRRNEICDDIVPKMEQIINDISNKFWFSTRDWIGVTGVLIKHKIIYNMNDWCEISAIKSFDPIIGRQRYTTEQNLRKTKEWVESGQVSKTFVDIPYITRIFNKYLPYKLTTSHSFDIYDVIRFIKHHDTSETLDINRITDDFIQNNILYEKSIEENGTKKNPYNKYKSYNIIFDRIGGWVDITGRPLMNYYLDGYLVDHKNTLYKGSIEYSHEYDDIKHQKIYNTIDDYLNNPSERIFTLGSFMGSGKTHYIIKYFLRQIHNIDPNLYNGVIGGITPSNTLNLETVKKLNNTNTFTFTSHTDQRSRSREYSNQEIRHLLDNGEEIPTDDKRINLFTSLESVNKLDDISRRESIYFLILDEITTVMNHFKCDSTTNLTPKKKYTTFQRFCEVLRSASKIGLFDAFICPNQMNLINKIISNDSTIPKKSSNLINVKQNNFRSYAHNIYKCKKTLNDAIFSKIKQNKQVAICSNSKQQINTYFRLLTTSSVLINKSILQITSDGLQIIEVFLNNNKQISQTTILDISKNKQVELKRHYSNLEDLIIDYKVNVFIFSPTITTGTSIDQKIFNSLFCIYSRHSMTARECIQQMYRIRNLKDKEINIYISENPKFPMIEREIATYKSYIEKPKLIRDQHFTDYDGPNVFIQDDLYTEMMAINTKEAYESEHSFYQTFYKLLKIDHNININFIRTKKDLNQNMSDPEDEASRKFNIWKNIPILTEADYWDISLLKDQIKDSRTTQELTDEQDEQHQKFNKIFKITEAEPGGPINFKSNGVIHYNDVFKPFPEEKPKDTENKDDAIAKATIPDPRDAVTASDCLTPSDILPRTNLLDNRNFYDNFILKTPKFQYIQKFLNYDKEKTIKKYIKDAKKYPQDPYKPTHTEHIEYELIKQIILLFGITPDSKTRINFKQIQQLLDNDPTLADNIMNFDNITGLDNSLCKKDRSNKFYHQMINTIKKLLKKINLFLKVDEKTTGVTVKNQYIIEQSGSENYKFSDEPRTNVPYRRFSNRDNETNITTYANKEGKNSQKTLSVKNMTFKKFNLIDIQKQIAPFYYQTKSKKLDVEIIDDVTYYTYIDNGQIYNYYGDIIYKRNRPYTIPLKIHLFKTVTDKGAYYKEYTPDIQKSKKIRNSMNQTTNESYKMMSPYLQLIENREPNIININPNLRKPIKINAFVANVMRIGCQSYQIKRNLKGVLPDLKKNPFIKSGDLFNEIIKRNPLEPLREYSTK